MIVDAHLAKYVSLYQIMQQLKVEKDMGAWLIICTTVQEQVETSMNEIYMQK
jgi:hypothetical protein